MASRDTRLCRRGPWRDGALVCNHIEPQTTDSRQHHVDGDILAQLIARSDAHAMLNEMLSAQPMQALLGEKADFETAEARRERFGVLVEQALTNLGELEGLDVEAEVASADSDSVTWALRYTRRLLELPF
ncbi:hypothetical protein FH972_021180 [Carpinus fangiana]|uniref:Uncharacterized protein n=1 Tax=Carpinus fangiana TaxID=176857 RepID=A0A5N6KNK7_9ROSI|nr:hypothetical protein FH972_021180 [Carpinus fangiana]